MISNHYTSPWTLSRLSGNINDTFHWSANAWIPFCFWMVTKCWKLVLKCGLTCILSKTRPWFDRTWNSFPLFYILFNTYNSVNIYSFNWQHQCVNQPFRDLFHLSATVTWSQVKPCCSCCGRPTICWSSCGSLCVFLCWELHSVAIMTVWL